MWARGFWPTVSGVPCPQACVEMSRRRTPARSPVDQLRRQLERTGLIRNGDHIVVGLSGGVDSVVLLHMLRFGLPYLVLRVEAAHLDHAMRPGSARDAEWVRGLCTAWSIPLHTARADPPPRSEAAARTARYEFLESAAPAGALIATGHHREDQAETVLLNAVRGTGLRGIRGIAPRRGRIVRPLLELGKEEVLAYARAHGIRYRTDPTNLAAIYARNRIRLEVMPALESIRPGAAASLARLAAAAREAEAGWQDALSAAEAEATVAFREGELTLARSVLHSYHPHLRARLLRRVLRRFGSTPDRSGTQAALEFISSGPSGGEVHLRGGVRLERDFDRIRIRPEPTGTGAGTALVIPDRGPGASSAAIGGRTVRVSWGEPPAAGMPEGRTLHVQDPEFPLTVRGWLPGDRIRLAYGSKKLKKLFVEGRLDRVQRERVPVVADALGRVLWVVGLARAAGTGEAGTGFQMTVEHGRD